MLLYLLYSVTLVIGINIASHNFITPNITWKFKQEINANNKGNVMIGADNPIALQTMTSCDTNDIDETVNQILKVRDYGADMVRVTVQSTREIKSSIKIKEKLDSIGCDIPLIADIHFNPKVALLAADIYDKVRVNPGNYVDGRKNWDEKVYDTEEEFIKSGEYIEEMFTPLIEKCKKLKRAIRIGTNHGSLSSRVMSYYGDSPRGMVESALEFAKICVKNDFHDIVFSMKSSNVYVMTHAYRLLVNEFYKRKWNYPIHLGVTEAGSVDDGRIKSVLGMGTLLLDGIGDTIRMSLTEDPWLELIPARKLLECVDELTRTKYAEHIKEFRDFNDIKRRKIDLIPSPLRYISASNTNDDQNKWTILNPDGSVGCYITKTDLSDPISLYKALGVAMRNGLPQRDLRSVDFVVLESVPEFHEYSEQRIVKELIEGGINVIAPVDKLKYNCVKFAIGLVDLDKLNEFQESQKDDDKTDVTNKIQTIAIKITGKETDGQLQQLCHNLKTYPVGYARIAFLIISLEDGVNAVAEIRRIFSILTHGGSTLPVVYDVDLRKYIDHEDAVIGASTMLCHLVDKMGEGVICRSNLPLKESNAIALDILQNARMRSFKTDFISCPSCGRTLFDIQLPYESKGELIGQMNGTLTYCFILLQKTTEEIKERMGHLPGVSIAVMGCIVNGIGEMADADFGYVGGSPGKVDLYIKKELVERNIPSEKACDKLVELIKRCGRWVDPPKG